VIPITRAVLISTYELGRQPFGLASPAAWLRQAGLHVTCADLSRQPLPGAEVQQAALVGFYLPMHTATRLAVPVIERVRQLNPAAHLCAYGLYAAINEAYLRSCGVESILGGEFEQDLVDVARRCQDPNATSSQVNVPSRSPLPRLRFLVPDRRDLPALTHYASLQLGPGMRKTVGYTEASRGCKHLCRHCPIVPVYNGQFRIVSSDTVLADIGTQVASGAGHITFGDPDFFNSVTHASRIVEALAREFPGVSYDVTIKVEHLLKHADRLRVLRDTGCLFVTTAVESLDDRVLEILDKGHTRADFLRVVTLASNAGLTLSPTFVAFTPWTTLGTYCDLLDTIEALDLVGHVAPIQWAIRLLLPEGSRLLELAEVRRLAGPLDPATLTYRWRHRDPAIDELQQEVERLVGARLNANRFEMFEEITAVAHARAGLARPFHPPISDRATVPFLNEPWYC